MKEIEKLITNSYEIADELLNATLSEAINGTEILGEAKTKELQESLDKVQNILGRAWNKIGDLRAIGVKKEKAITN